MSELTVAKLAIPRKASITRQTAEFTSTETAYNIDRVSASQVSVAPDISGWGVTVYTNNSSDTITRISDITTGFISYRVISVGTIDGYNEERIECTKPDGSTFMINPGYSLGSGNYVVDIRFHSWWYRTGLSRAHVQLSGSIPYPYSREIRTADGVNFGIALSTDFLAFKVEYRSYYAPTETLSDWKLSGVLDSMSDTRAGTGGLTAYRVKAGAWDTDRITPKMQDLSLTF